MTDQTNVAIWPRPLRAFMSFNSNLIGPELFGERRDSTASISNTAITILCAVAAVSILLVALGHGAGRRGNETLAATLFWIGVLGIIVPVACRIAWPVLARAERLVLLVLLAEALLVYHFLYSPTGFTQFDEFLHWITAQDMLLRHKLFLENSLLPISPFYPALELIVTSIANLTGWSIFPLALIFIVILRAIFIVGLFLFFEKITGSARIAALACLVYMSSSTFVLFNAGFAYETLAVVLYVLVMLAEAEASRGPYTLASSLLLLVLLAVLAMTHHMTAFACALYLVGVTFVQAAQKGQPLKRRLSAGLLLVIAFGLPVLWVVVSNNPLVSYLGPVFELGFDSVYAKLNGESPSQAREFFVSGDGNRQPIANIIIGVASPLFLAIALATGFFRSLALKISARANGWWRLWYVLRRQWTDSRIIVLTIGAFGFPASVAFRLTSTGWEIGNRMGTYAFFSVGLVVAIAIVHYWQTRPTKFNLSLTSLLIATIIVGGVMTGSGYRQIRGGYLVIADTDSVEPMGIDAALWTKEWLGPGNRFAADRINRTLLATYGDQDIVSSLSKDRDVNLAPLFLSKDITPDNLYAIRKAKIKYMMVDMRVTMDKPVMGHLYEQGESAPTGYPPSPRSLLKFDSTPEASRIFDDGDIIIYDMSKFYEEP